jgi:thiosulfate/3-mercaptopyruvate sulfurtransferase
MSNLIHSSEANLLIGHPNTVFADVRFVLGEASAGYSAYLEDHIPGAVFFDLNVDLSGAKQEHGGGHPLLDLDLFAAKLGQAGIDNLSEVIVYDDQGGSIASRLWWMLKHAGHDKVRLLSDGYRGWVTAGYPVTSEPSEPEVKSFFPRLRDELQATIEEVKDRIGKPNAILIDSRIHDRYTGENKTKYLKAGHIPGAINHYWEDGSPQGVFLGVDKQRKRFSKIPTDHEIIVYCGAGVTACPNVLALTEAGYEHVKLYVGSWSDWISYSENPIATGEE